VLIATENFTTKKLGRKIMKIHNTNVTTKTKYWPIFEKMIRNQFEAGGEKYALDGQIDKEATDWVCELVPGETGSDWVLGTMAKYLARFKNFKREKDLLKIATYCFIVWLKMGYHLKEKHDEDI
jgi:hypothetical protein